jgi:hypothetical protein
MHHAYIKIFNNFSLAIWVLNVRESLHKTHMHVRIGSRSNNLKFIWTSEDV